jgi:hypothetical protein
MANQTSFEILEDFGVGKRDDFDDSGFELWKWE